MAYTDIDNPSDYFSATLYTANGTARTIATGHQSDWVWLKRRDGAAGHRIADSVRGANKLLYSDSTTSEQSASNTITGFVSTGFTLGDDSGGYDVNTSSNTMVAWSWKAGGSASSNSDGSTTSSVSAGNTQGFSIVSWTGTGSATTVGHGLGAVPKFIIVKNRDTARNWNVYYADETDYLQLNDTSATTDNDNKWNDTAPTSSVFTVNTSSDTNKSGDAMIAYCFADVKGYSKFGSYTGNGSATNGVYIHLGFKAAWFMCKRTNASGHDWVIFNNKALGYNVDNNTLLANSSAAEGTADRMDILSNGVKMYNNNGSENESGGSYIYMAFAESPFTNSNGIPNNAR